jgi:ketosteroid isomerase-like protein
MKFTVSLLVASFLILSAGFATTVSPRDESASQKQISDTLRQMYEAEKRKDLHFVLSHLSEDFAEVAGDGNVYHRADIEAGWSDVKLHNYTLSDCTFKLMTRDAAYLSCRMEVNATYKGQPFPPRSRVTTVWTRQKGQWLVRFEQGTLIPEPNPDQESDRKNDSPAKLALA